MTLLTTEPPHRASVLGHKCRRRRYHQLRMDGQAVWRHRWKRCRVRRRRGEREAAHAGRHGREMPHTPPGEGRSGNAIQLRQVQVRGEGHIRLRVLVLLLSLLLLLHVQLLTLLRKMLFMQVNLVRQKHLVHV